MQSPSPAQPTSPTIITQSTPYPGSSNSKQKYLCSVIGLCRVGIILFQMAGWIAAASVPIYINGLAYLPPELSATRDAYLFFSITGFVVAVVVFIVYFFNLTTKKPFNKLPNDLFVLATDIIWIIPTFILAVISAVREGNVQDPLFLYGLFINRGAFATAAAFGFLASLLYGVDIAFLVLKIVRGKK